ncbi:unnamed protein product [Owenia fusiformis]|uniref:Uncharacterized protein n=1 Tax=Owenia fusiformis TaxID=6347 RepID=A0A8J1Y7W7_OWEFU|nr:unnamed protein product [Owenia fusiformis]
MASSSPKNALIDEYQELLTCIMCTETFKNAKSLSCGHSYCKNCLKTWIEKNKEKRNETFPCPICNAKHEIPKNGVDDYHTNITINSMVEILENQLSRDKNSKANCDICAQEGDDVPAISRCVECAENLCQACNKSHKRSQGTRSHNMYDLTGDPEKDARLALDNYVKRNIQCPKHQDQPLKFFCSKDKAIVCTHCCITEHPGHACQAIEEAADKEKRNISALFGLANQRKELFEKFIQDSSDNLQSYEENRQSLLKEIDTDHAAKCKELDEHFAKLHKELDEQLARRRKEQNENHTKLRNEAKAVANEKTKKIQAKQDQHELEKGIAESTLLHLTALIKHGHPVDIMNSSTDTAKKLQDWGRIPEEDEDPVDKYTYQPGTFDTANMVKLQHGIIPETLDKGCIVKKTRYCDPKVTRKVKLGDKNQGVKEIYGATKGYNNTIVLCHESPDGMSSYTADTFTKQHTANGGFNDVCCMQGNLYAAIDCNNKCISIYNHNLVHQKNIGKFQRPCGICEAPGKGLLVVDNTDKCVYLVDYNDGKILATIGKGHLTDPLFVTINSNSTVFISDYGAHCVKGFTMQGEEVNKYGTQGGGPDQLNVPSCVCIDPDNNLIIADQHNHRVVLVDENCKFIKYLLEPEDGMKYPQSVIINNEGDLTVGAESSGDLFVIRYKQ